MTSIPIKPALAEFRELALRGNLVPVCAELIADAETPVWNPAIKSTPHSLEFLVPVPE